MNKRKLRYKQPPAKRLCVEKNCSFLFHSALFAAISLWVYILIRMVIDLKHLRDANISY
jgi:hypothetical protein